MPVEITIPSPGESISEVTLGPWHVDDGAWVDKDDLLVEIESDKVTLELPAPESGVLKRAAAEGDELKVGHVIGAIDTTAARPAGAGAGGKKEVAASASAGEAPGAATTTATATATASTAPGGDGPKATSVARKIAADKGVSLSGISGTGPSGRITKADVLSIPPPASVTGANGSATPRPSSGPRCVRRERMSKLRRRIAERLVEAQHTAAMLTTFNEIDMTAVMATRTTHKEAFEKTHGVGLGFMSFFVKACTSALAAYPRVNAYIVGDEVEFHDFVDVSVAVGTDKGLVVPVLRNVETMSFADVEATIRDFAGRAREGKLSIDEMTGGTFTISNGGVYGSLNSTPILNPPQSGILGMHKIMKRAVEDPNHPGQIALRPMMYVALSYDHRIVDGAEAVGFLVHVKSCLEDPTRMMLGI